MEELPKATHEGVLKIGNQEIRVYRLDNGQAIIHADDMFKIFEADFTAEESETFIKQLKEIGHSA